jgi:SET domain/Glucose / Sorbosone dehydrogenase
MWATRRGPAALVIAFGLLTAACSGGAAGPGTPPATGPGGPLATAGSGAPSSAAAFGAARVRLVQVASVQQPVAMAVRPGERAVYVAEQTGRVHAIRSGRLDPGPVLDVSSQIVAGGEQGLLGLAFSPDGRLLYVDFTDRNGDTQVTEFAMRGRRADPASGRLVLRVGQPFANHNGGQLAFGPAEYDGVMMRVNHSCEPNVGMGGNVLLVSMRDIAAGEELTIDYALFLGDPGFAMQCRCGAAACRGVVRGTDWMRADLRAARPGWRGRGQADALAFISWVRLRSGR